MKRTFLAGIGDANDPRTWSGTPFHLLEAGCKCGIFDEGLNLSVTSWAWRVTRVLWNIATLMRGRRYGGFQYSDWFLERLYAPVQSRLQGNRIINWCQLFPASIVSNEAIEKWFYIDMTLRQLFRCYELGASMDKRARESAIEREKDGYRAAKGIMTLSQWAAESVVRDYGIPPARVHAIVPGANIAAGHYSKWFSVASYRQADPERPLRLVFTGKYWKRKGLDRLLEAFLLARARGANLSLRVIGVDRETIPTKYCDATAVEWIGFLDKRTESTAFLNAVSDCDIGCLLSRAEAAGIAVREYCALGLVTLCTDAGGMPEMPIPEASLSVPVDASNEETAEVLLRLCRDRQATEQMRQRAWSLRCEALWDSAVAQMRTQLQTS